MAAVSPHLHLAERTSIDRELSQMLRGHLVSLLRCAAESGLSALDIEILRLLGERGACRASAIAEEFLITRTSVSRHVSELIDAGLLDEQPDPSDGRASLLALSEVGRSALCEQETRRTERFARLTADWSDRERETFACLLGRLNGAAREMIDELRQEPPAETP